MRKAFFYGWLDIGKFFFAICIVAIHTHLSDMFPGAIGYIVEKCIFRLAVPFFFVVSGFLFEEKVRNVKHEVLNENIKHYCIRMLKPLLIFESINVILIIGKTIISSGWGGVNRTFLLQIIQNILFYPYGALWYLQACIVGMILLSPFLKHKRLNMALILGLILYLFALFCNNYYFIAEKLKITSIINGYLSYFVSARNGLFTGFMFLAIGIKCSEIKHKIEKYSSNLVKFTLVIYAFYLIEIILVHLAGESIDDGSLYIMHIVLVPCIVLLAVIYYCPVQEKLCKTLRYYSTGIYLLHRIILLITEIFAIMSGAEINCVFVFAIVTLSSAIVCRIVFKSGCKPLYSLLS